MKKFLWLIIIILMLLTGCVNTPDGDLDLDATIQAAVNNALESYVSDEELLASQNEQTAAMQQFVVEKLDAATLPTAVSVAAQPVKRITQAVNLADEACTNFFTYVSDITIPDGMKITPGTEFTKSWYVTNSGTCSWNDRYKLVYNTGAQVGTADSFSFLDPGVILKPGESIVVSAQIKAPTEVETAFSTYWALESDKGEVYGGGKLQNIFLSSNFYVSSEFNFVENFSSAVCSDDSGIFACGSTSSSNKRGFAYYDGSPTLESNYTGMSAIMISPPYTVGGKTRVEIGPVRIPKGTWFRMAFSCRPDTPGCRSWVRLYVRETGFSEKLIEETLEWNEGFVTDWNIRLSDRGFYNQDLTYIFEVEAVGDGDKDDLIIIQNPRLTEYGPAAQ